MSLHGDDFVTCSSQSKTEEDIRYSKACSRDQDCCSFHDPGSEAYHYDHRNTSISLWKFAETNI